MIIFICRHYLSTNLAIHFRTNKAYERKKRSNRLLTVCSALWLLQLTFLIEVGRDFFISYAKAQ